MPPRYELLEQVGKGGFGVVHRARAPDGSFVAVKRLERSDDRTAAARFLREGRLARELGARAGFVPVLDTWEEQGALFIAMPFLPGGTLRQRLEQRRQLPAAEVARLGRTLARALSRAHARNIIHRDVKPENVLFDGAGRPLIADLGLAKAVRIDPSKTGSAALTGSLEIAGTVAYMSPEHMEGSRGVGPAADVWALGVLLYECLSGELPFDTRSVADYFTALAHAAPIPLGSRAPAAPPALVATIERCLTRDAAGRPTAATLARSFGAEPLALGVRGALALVATSLTALVAVALFVARGDPTPPARPPVVVTTTTPTPAAAWRLGDAPPLYLSDALWLDSYGAEAWPLLGVEEAGQARALAAAFPADEVDSTAGVVRRRWGAAALARVRPRAMEPSVLALLGAGEDLPVGPLSRATDEGLALDAPLDGGDVLVPLGRGRWRDARIAVTVRARPGFRSLVFGVGEAALGVGGLDQSLVIGLHAVSWAPGRERLELRLDPRARGDERVVAQGRRIEALAGAAAALDPSGAPWLCARGGSFEVLAVEVAGVPVTADAPALAAAPLALEGDARVDLAFEVAAPVAAGAGGAFVGIGAPHGDAVLLALDGARLLLVGRGTTWLEVALPAPAARGRLTLERRGDTFVGALTDDDGTVTASLEAVDPLPLPGPARALWGSDGPRVRFADVSVTPGEPDVERAARDAAADGALAEQLERRPGGRAAWWRGALALARVLDPARADPTLRGTGAWEARTAVLRSASADLLAAADAEDLPPAIRRDAAARAVLACAHAGDGAGAVRFAAQLVADEGLAGARARVDALERDARGAGVALSRMAAPWVHATTLATSRDRLLALGFVGDPGVSPATDVRPDSPLAAAGLAAGDAFLGFGPVREGRLELFVQRPGGARRLLRVNPDDPLQAALRAARILAPERAADIEGRLAWAEKGAHDRSEGRPHRDVLLALVTRFESALGAGAGAYQIHTALGDVYDLLAPTETDAAQRRERQVKARAAWRRAQEIDPLQWFPWLRDAQLTVALDGGDDAALEAALERVLGALALRPAARDALAADAAELARASRPGLRACATLALGLPDAGGVRRDALEATRSLDPRECDLGRYALRRLGDAVAPPGALEGDRPTLALLRASLGQPDGLAQAAWADPLVRHLAWLDGELAPAVPRSRP